MKKTSGFNRPFLALLALLPLAGCSSNFVLPWEVNQLDPSQVATREPLEIPPDLDVLPSREAPDEPGVGRITAPRDEVAPLSARSILFKTPAGKADNEVKPLGREEQERLPGWLGSGRGGR
ncbi:MAG: hypothetical protein HQL91_02840 [Magnetococcales bacterium]|nr:hypothetical protein [Magnetococcales bacterium]